MSTTGNGPRALVVALAAVAFAACGGEEPYPRPEQASPVTVAVSEAVGAAGRTIHPATVLSTDEVDLATRVSGSIRRIRAEVGTPVEEGEVLVELDAADLEARIEGAEAAVERTRRRYERIRNLERDGAATEQELDDARAELRRAEAKLDDVRAQNRYAVLRAPFSGTVTARFVDPGDLAVPGQPLLGLVRPASLKVVSDLAGEVGDRIEPGEWMTVRDPGTDRGWGVRVTRIAPARDPVTQKTRVELRFQEAGEDRLPLPFPGSFVRLERIAPEVTTVWIPRDALIRRGQLSGVYTVIDDRLRLRWIRTGLQEDDALEVLSGVSSGAVVVREPGSDLTDAMPVAARTIPWTPRPSHLVRR